MQPNAEKESPSISTIDKAKVSENAQRVKINRKVFLIAVFGFVILIYLGIFVATKGVLKHTSQRLTNLPNVISPATSQQATSNTTIGAITDDMLSNIKQNGFNPYILGGGLWINWKYGTNPLQANFNGTGEYYPNGLGLSHDRLTDIRYLHNLWLYKTTYPKAFAANGFQSEIDRYTPIVKNEFQHSSDERGWLFDEELIDVYHLSDDTFYKDAALSLAANYSNAIKPNVGIMYKVSASHPQGFYRPADVIEAGCALVDAGTLFQNSQWVQQGQTAIQFVFKHAFISGYNTLGDQMDQVLTANRQVNPSEIFYVDTYKNYTIYGNAIRVGPVSQIAISLLHSYQITHNQKYLSYAQQLLDPFALPNNSLGMWDTSSHMGYFASVSFGGTSPQNPGTMTINSGKKESGRQIAMLWAFHVANQLTNGKYQQMENAMKTVATDPTKAYFSQGHGVLYETNASWQPLKYPNGQPNEAVTTEAMGIEVEALLSTARNSLW